MVHVVHVKFLEVLNDTWRLYSPLHDFAPQLRRASAQMHPHHSKSQQMIFRCEEERFEVTYLAQPRAMPSSSRHPTDVFTTLARDCSVT